MSNKNLISKNLKNTETNKQYIMNNLARIKAFIFYILKIGMIYKIDFNLFSSRHMAIFNGCLMSHFLSVPFKDSDVCVYLTHSSFITHEMSTRNELAAPAKMSTLSRTQ